MKRIPLLFCLATLFCVTYAQALQIYYMTDYITRIDLTSPFAGYSSSGILRSHRGLTYPIQMNKTISVSVPTGYSLLVSIRLIDLRPSNQDTLTIFAINGQVTPVTFTNNNYFRRRKYDPNENITFFAPNGLIGIRFTTSSSYITYGCEGFELVYTTIATGYRCNGEDFHCYNGRCIAHELKCDDHNHCGDRSSLKYCNRYTGSGKNVGIAIGIVFLIIATACGIFIGIRKARRDNTNTHTIITSHPPPTNQPNYPPAYPQPGAYYPPPPPPYSQGIVNPTYH